MWEAQIKVGDVKFTKELMIETIKPNRLKVNLNFEEEIITNNKKINIELTSNWLHGAPAKGLLSKIEMNLSESRTKFDNFKNYNFDDYIKSFHSPILTPIELKLDKKGKAIFQPLFKAENNAPGMLKATFKTRVFEKGGNFSVDRILIPYSPYRSYVGFKMPEGNGWNKALYSNEKNLIPIATVDEYGNIIDRENVKIEVFEINWQWWYQTSSKRQTARYVTGSNRKLISEGYINTKNGQGIYQLDLNKNLYGRYYIRVTDPISKHSSGQIFYLSYKGYWNANGKKAEGAEMLAFETNKKTYNVGETVKVTLPNIKKGRVLISVESGDNVFETYWFDAHEGKNTFSFKTTKKMTPNVYLNLTFIQPHKQTENDLPIRMYGVKGISIQDPETHLHPIIKMPKELRPEESTTIEISEQEGRKMTYTIALVDEGLLDLTHFKTPQPWNKFYTHQSLAVKTWDMYRYVSGAFSGQMAGLLEIGGDEYSKEKNKKKANRFKPVVKFLGPFTLEPGKNNKHTFTIPNYVGSVRTMVVAGYDGAYGSTEETTPVKKPLMVLSTLPRVLSPQEIVEVPVTVFAMDEKIQKVNVKIDVNEKFEIIGSNNQKVNFNNTGEKVITFKLRVKEYLGFGKVNITCKSGREIARHETEIDVRMPNPEIQKVISKVIQPNNSWITDYEAFGVNGTNNGSVEISTVPPINLEKRLNYLIRYPHGCIEQTTSAAFPQLYLTKLTELNNHKKAEVQNNIREALWNLKSFQTRSGGFSYWPSHYSQNSEWGTNYAGHFMIEAKNMGYQLPIGLLEKWLKHQTTKANDWHLYTNIESHHITRSSELNQAYRLYVLALADKPAISAMNKMRNYSDLSNIAKWRLAAAYTLIGRKDVAEDLLYKLSTKVEDYETSSHTYGSRIRDKAMILETMSLLKDYEKGKELLDLIAKKLSSNEYMSTQTTAYSLLAISKFIFSSGMSDSFTFNYNSQEIEAQKSYHQIKLDVLSSKKGTVNLTNKSDNILFASINLSGVPIYSGEPINEDNGINMEVEYFTMNHQSIDIQEIEQGTDFYTQTTITNTGQYDYENLALNQIFPSGWEIRNTRMDLSEENNQSEITYQDIRDDRVYSYFDLQENKTITVKIQLNASYLGKYYLPTVNCEAMYNNKINAQEGGMWVEVIKQNTD